MGMADGGLVDLPIPDNMFPDDNYAGGGMVAFAEGDKVPGAAPEDPYSYANNYGLSANPMEAAAMYDRLFTPQTQYTDQTAAYYEGLMSPEAQEKSRKEDLYTMLAQIGFGMAGTNSPSFLQAAGQAASAAIPGAVQARRERKAEQRQGLGALTGIEAGRNESGRARAGFAVEQAGRGATLQEGRESSRIDREFRAGESEKDRNARLAEIRLQNAGRGGGGGGGGGGATMVERYAGQIYASLRGNPANANYSDAQLQRQATQTAVRELAAAEGGDSGGPTALGGAQISNVVVGGDNAPTAAPARANAPAAPARQPTREERAAAFSERSAAEQRRVEAQRQAVRDARAARTDAQRRRQEDDRRRGEARRAGETYRREQ
jgi:hypothetical protein